MSKKMRLNINNKKKYYIFSLIILIFVLLFAIVVPLVYKQSYSDVNLNNIFKSPDHLNRLGTDRLGRDVLIRISYGMRVSLIVGLVAAFIQTLIGVVLGVISGYFGGKVDFLIMRFTDVVMSFPFFLVAMAIVSIFGTSLFNLIIIISILSWTEICRVVRSQTLSLKKLDYIKIEKCIGFSDFSIIKNNILKNIVPTILVSQTIAIANSILMESALSFLSLGVKEPMPSLGNMLSEAQNITSIQNYWWSWLPPGLIIILIVLGINFAGEYLRLKGEENNIVENKVYVNVDFKLKNGKITALVGESGSGKTITALALLGLETEVVSVKGIIEYKGINLLNRPKIEVRKDRGKKVGMIFQEPSKSLSPLMKVGYQVDDVLKISTKLDKKKRYEEVIRLFKLVNLDKPEEVYYKLPYELSGGMRQRVQIAVCLASNPEILIADEPTSSVDKDLKEGILSLLSEISKNLDVSVLLITHDLKKLENYIDDIVVMKKCEIVEKSSSKDFFKEPKSEYGKLLLDAVYGNHLRDEDKKKIDKNNVVLELENISKSYTVSKGIFNKKKNRKVLDNFSMKVYRGEILGISAPSGKGKSTLARIITNMEKADKGIIKLDGKEYLQELNSKNKKSRLVLRKRVQMILQDPYTSLNPKNKIGKIIDDGLILHYGLNREKAKDKTINMLKKCMLNEKVYNMYPDNLSGGMKQRVNIARILSLRPEIVICDEITSALDVITQAKIIRLILNLRKNTDTTFVFISHDRDVLENICDRIVSL